MKTTHTPALDILVTESEPGTADDVIFDLESAGHRVHRCHEPGRPAFPCRSLDTGDCPLDAGTVDVALTIRARPRSVPAALEDGVSCALQHRIPLVVSGRVALNPYEEFATEVVDQRGSVVEAVERAAISSLRDHERLAADAAHTTLAVHGYEGAAVEARAHRARGVVTVQIGVPADIDRTVRDMIGTRALSALRNFDRHARQIDVAVD